MTPDLSRLSADELRALGRAYRLRCTVNNTADGQPSLLEDPVINYAARTFGGQPRRVVTDSPEPRL